MKALYLIVVAALLSGCDQVPKNSHPAASGAFGWVFGEKLPDQYSVQVDKDGMNIYTYAPTNGFFEQIEVAVDNQRRICEITGYRDAGTVGVFDIQNLANELENKYGLDEKTDTSYGRFWTFGSGKEINFSVFNGKITLVYSYEKLLRPLLDKLYNKENQQFKKSVQGI